jgi:dUTP pyrophosphatase
MKEVDIKILNPLMNESISLPSYGTDGSGGMDLRACIDSPIEISPSETIMIPMGFAMHLGNKEYAALVIPRSGLGSKHGIVLGNLVGLIDSDYQGEELFTINPGDRIAQMIIVPVAQVKFNIVKEFDKSERGEKGFGSSGIN